MGCPARGGAAARFVVAVSLAIKWVDRWQETDGAAPGKMAGHNLKKIAGVQADWLCQRCRERAPTLRGLVKEPASERGLKVDFRSVWAFVHAEKRSYKKRRWSPVTAITATSPGAGWSYRARLPRWEFMPRSG